MRISRVVVRNFRCFELLDIPLAATTTCVIGENNTGKTNLLHAIRLCIDAACPSSYRTLIPSDIHSTVDISHPSEVLVGLEFSDFAGKTNEEALVGAWQTGLDTSRLIYRFRPKLAVREDLESGDKEAGQLTIDDYQWEMVGGGDPKVDLASISWDQDIGASIRFSDLQAFLVVFLPALRDVESDLRNFRSSPLARLITAMEIDTTHQDELVALLKKANDRIAAASSVNSIAKAIDESFKEVAGPAFSMDVSLGVAEPSFQSIIRALRVLLSNSAMENFDTLSNGRGLNNILYISILIEYFHRRVAQKKSAGQIILFEEPEAHLHPQLQVTLFKALSALPFQSILTTHSTHITANAGLSSYIVLTQKGLPAIASSAPAIEAKLEESEVLDLERYLDATKSNLLFARKVILVEGPAELFLIPALLRQVENIDLDREGISVIPIYGVHFDVYAKLFCLEALPKKCAIIADGDLKASDAMPDIAGEDDLPAPPNLDHLQNDYVKVFACKTTFERALTLEGNLEMFALAADEIGATTVAENLRDGARTIEEGDLGEEEVRELLKDLRKTVLNTAKRFGKARFAQIASRFVGHAGTTPKYIRDAAEWLMQQ